MTEAVDNVKTLIDYVTGRELKPQMFGNGAPFAVIPPGYTVADVERHLPTPARKRGSVTLLDETSFCAYVRRHAEKTSTVIYANTGGPALVAVLDDHKMDADEVSGSRWREHRATYPCPLSREWKTWAGSHGKRVPQGDFAEFIEDSLLDICAPDHATMLEVSRSLVARKSVNFESKVSLENGSHHFVYTEDVQSRAGKGQLEVPAEFAIRIPVFKSGPLYQIGARLRYRIDDGKLLMWYDLVRHLDLLDTVFTDLAERVRVDTGVPVLTGTP